jgi:hypothetical protein
MRHCLNLIGWGMQRLFILTTVLAFSVLCPAQGMRMTTQQVWSGLSSVESSPYYALIENHGANDYGSLTANSPEIPANLEYPIELPSGSTKRVLFLTGGWNDGKVYLRTNGGIKEATIKFAPNQEQTRYGLISDNPSDLIFMKSQSDTQGGSNAVGVGGCVPDDAPDRSWGYECLDAVVLGDGTEKLRNDQILAIKHYVQEGGVVLFVGGAAPSASSDQRWNDFLPTTNSSVITSQGLTERVGFLDPSATSVKINHGSCFTRSYGLGLVSMLTVNPFESPIKGYDDRRSMMSRAMPRNRHTQIRDLITQQLGTSNEGARSYSHGYLTPSRAVSAVYPSSGPSGSALPQNDPFLTKPPSVESIMWILIAYGIVVIPVNFFILKKLNRLEVAWISTPIISVLFSGILLNSTIGLYKSLATTRTTSVAVLARDSRETMIFARSEMFFPRAKSYNLHLVNVESLIAQQQYGEASSGGINLIDDGRQIMAPSVNTGNLAFKEISYIQSSGQLAGLTMNLETEKSEIVLHLRNSSHINLHDIVVYGAGFAKALKEQLPIGANVSITVTDVIRSKLNSKNNSNVDGWQLIAAASPCKLIVIGKADAMRVGPNYGEPHPASQYLVIAAPERGRL